MSDAAEEMPTPVAASRERNRHALRAAAALTAAYFVAELVGGLLTNSLALLSDAVHMFTDITALMLALFGVWIAGRPATESKTYGYYRAEILIALVNGLVLWFIVVFIFWEAWHRFWSPPVVRGGGVSLVAGVGLVVNAVSARLLASADTHNLGVRGALLHVLSDLIGSFGALVSGVVIVLTGWRPADAVASVVIGCLILFSSWTLIREAVDILMEAVPRHIDLEELRQTLGRVPGAVEVHDLHVWSLTTGHYALSAHAVVAEGSDTDGVLAEMTDQLAERFDIRHVTIQLESRNRRHVEPVH